MENKINSGEYVIAYNEEDLELPAFENLVTLMELSKHSLYHVGFKMGEILTSLRNLLPEAKLGGAELEDLHAAYSHKLFNNRDLNIKMEVKNFVDGPTSEQYEVVFSDDVLHSNNLEEQKAILKNMLASSSGYVVFFDKPCPDLIGYAKFLGHNVSSNDDVTIITKVEKKPDVTTNTKNK